MQKSEKSLEPFLRKLCYQPTNQPTNQPIITNNTDFIGLADAGPTNTRLFVEKTIQS